MFFGIMGMHIHWYLTSRCNMKCSFCFKPEFSGKPRLHELSEVLAQEDVDRVTITGGEPTLIKSLEEILTRLKKAGVYTSLHTNGLLLDRDKIDRLKDVVGDIAVPLDSMNRQTQAELRGMDYLPEAKRVIRDLQDARVKLGVHTVFSAFNALSIPSIHRFLRLGGYDYWRIYEFNPEFVQWITPYAGKSRARLREIAELAGGGTLKKGFTDCLFAEFLLLEKKMRKTRDRRMQFVSRIDPRRANGAHPLHGRLEGKWSCWLGYNIRMVYSIDDRQEMIIIEAVGSHKIY